ncbi:hypothetical protein [Coxiella burnetii]|uniref:hypothetical protein n=1 Tax=Coxiella burnetii TaxID=777 RepID=UPI00217676AA|nr:hypothetical protein [Coxiella burnetii]
MSRQSFSITNFFSPNNPNSLKHKNPKALEAIKRNLEKKGVLPSAGKKYSSPQLLDQAVQGVVQVLTFSALPGLANAGKWATNNIDKLKRVVCGLSLSDAYPGSSICVQPLFSKCFQSWSTLPDDFESKMRAILEQFGFTIEVIPSSIIKTCQNVTKKFCEYYDECDFETVIGACPENKTEAEPLINFVKNISASFDGAFQDACSEMHMNAHDVVTSVNIGLEILGGLLGFFF